MTTLGLGMKMKAGDEADDKADAWISENQPVRGDFSTCHHQL